MKTSLRIFLLLFVFAVSAAQAQKKEKSETVYMFGYGTSFNNDTTQYITAVQPVEGATLHARTKFLETRAAYAAQLENYLESTFAPNQTCAVFFSTSRKRLEKKFLRIRRELYQRKPRKVIEIQPDAFKFEATSTNAAANQP